MNYFSVPKGNSDIRMVYDGTKSGLNDCLYAPWFILPDADVLLRTLDSGYWCINNDYGEMFLNFWIHPELRIYSGMDLTPLYGKNAEGKIWVENMVSSYGPKPLTLRYHSANMTIEMIHLRKSKQQQQHFPMDHVRLNLPGTVDYQPGEPWVSKRRSDGLIAADAHDYVDDLRGTAPTAEEAWQLGSTIAKTASYIGIQDAARKRREQTRRPGAWAGVVCGTIPDRPYITVTLSKWEKTKTEIARLRSGLDKALAQHGDCKMNRKMLEQVTGYLNHVARAFPTIKLYLNGVYATMNAWRPDRDEEGWRLGNAKVESLEEEANAPSGVRMVPRMEFDVQALEKLTQTDQPPECILRPCKLGARPQYCFADASGAGLGVSQWSPGDTHIEVDYGSWGDGKASNSSSNFRELGNIVQKIERMNCEGKLTNMIELFIFTDNTHAESAFDRGTAKSPEVLGLMFRLHRILMKGYAFIHVIWVAGKQMIDQGTDGLSRSNLTSGVMRGLPMLYYVPLHQTAIERQPMKLLDFLKEICPSGD
ncbi:hypothetical protein ACA910_010211 [Epithemia clementina (nom. ined.)]